MEYKIVASKGENVWDDDPEIESLEEEVRIAIENGWKPLGGIAVRIGTQRGAYFLQAMVKE